MKACEARSAVAQRKEDELALLQRKTRIATEADYKHRLATIRRL